MAVNGKSGIALPREIGRFAVNINNVFLKVPLVHCCTYVIYMMNKTFSIELC